MPSPDEIDAAVAAARPSSAAAKKLREEVATAGAPVVSFAPTTPADAGEPTTVISAKKGVEASKKSRDIDIAAATSMAPVTDDAAVGGGSVHGADECAKMIKRETGVELVRKAEATSWAPEYEAQGVLPSAVTNKSRYAMANEEMKTGRTASTTVATRNTNVSLNMILKEQPMLRKTKVVCTMG